MHLSTKIGIAANVVSYGIAGIIWMYQPTQERLPRVVDVDAPAAIHVNLSSSVNLAKLTTVPYEADVVKVPHAVNRTPKMVPAKQIECLAINIYHEARGESLAGQRAVAWVTLNRVTHKEYPNTICGVVYQAKVDDRGRPIKNKCQFSWYCDGKADIIRNDRAWKTAMTVAANVATKYVPDPTKGSFMYHADYVQPWWAASYRQKARIDTHIFYSKG